jgi:hypothetical protein
MIVSENGSEDVALSKCHSITRPWVISSSQVTRLLGLPGSVDHVKGFVKNVQLLGYHLGIAGDGFRPISILPTKQVARLSTPILRKALKDILFAD